MAGPTPETSDAEVLRYIALHPEPVITASDLLPKMDMTRQGVYNRLESLADDGYLATKKVGNAAKVYWLTPSGRSLAAEAE